MSENPSKLEFFITELLVFVSLIATVGIVIFLLSDRFGNEGALTSTVMSKLQANSGEDFLLTLGATTFVIGIFAAIHFYSEIAFLSRVMVAVLEELPRIMYLFGANLTAATLIVGFYLAKYPDGVTQPSRLYSLAAFFGLSMFAYGFALRYKIQQKTRGFRSDAA